MSIYNKVVPIATKENISPFSAVSGPLRALNIIGALPLKFHEDISGKIKVMKLPNIYVVTNAKRVRRQPTCVNC